LVLGFSTPSEAQYPGLEPERLADLESRTAPGGEVDVALRSFAEGNTREALAAIDQAIARDASPELYYARVLLRLRADDKVPFSELRRDLMEILRRDSSFPGGFDLWMSFNPTEEELRNEAKALALDAAQRAEVLLRLGEVKDALRLLRGIDGLDGEPAWRVRHALARAYFLLASDAAGENVYRGLLDDLSETAAGVLYRDLAPIATPGERDEFQRLGADERSGFFHRFWMKRHPLPGQDLNPRLGEHYRRLAKALADYPLQSTGRGYFTDRGTFGELSPALPYYDSRVAFEAGAASAWWLDPRGWMLLRHGEPDVRIGPRRFSGSDDSDTWLTSRALSGILIFNFVKRPEVGEWTLALNLAVAAGPPGTRDEPTEALRASRAVTDLYRTRYRLHEVYRQAAEARSLVDLERALRAESQLMAAFVKASLAFDSTAFFTRENVLPLAVSVSNVQVGGQPSVLLDFAVDLKDVDFPNLDSRASLEVTAVAFDRQWTREQTRVTRSLPLAPPPDGKSKAFVGRIELNDLNPEEYRLTLQVRQPQSGRIGVAKGRHAVSYVPAGHLGLSDLLLSQLQNAGPERDKESAGSDATGRWLPAPARVVSKKAPFAVEFELYNLKLNASGNVRYQIEEKVLTLYEKPGFFSQLAGYAQLAGQIFFPVYAFAGQVGAFTLLQATASETDGIEVDKRLAERQLTDGVVREEIQLDLDELKPGVYTVYVTVRDLESQEITSKFLTFQLT
jgi:GWxTD domain-containing protein